MHDAKSSADICARIRKERSSFRTCSIRCSALPRPGGFKCVSSMGLLIAVCAEARACFAALSNVTPVCQVSPACNGPTAVLSEKTPYHFHPLAKRYSTVPGFPMIHQQVNCSLRRSPSLKYNVPGPSGFFSSTLFVRYCPLYEPDPKEPTENGKSPFQRGGGGASTVVHGGSFRFRYEVGRTNSSLGEAGRQHQT